MHHFALRLFWISSVACAAVAGDLYRAECSACHGDTGEGNGPAAAFLPSPPRDFTKKKFKLRSTAPGTVPARSDIFQTLTRGIRSQAMPAFEYLNPAQREELVGDVLAFGRWDRPAPAAPSPIATGAVARGAEVYRELACARCHLPSDREALPEPLTDEAGKPVRAPHLALDEFFGGTTPADVYARVTHGMEGTPMPAFVAPEADRVALAHHVAGLRQPRAARRFADERTRGELALKRYRCQACHVIRRAGAQVGPSLDVAGRKLSESWIRAWLANPRARGKIFNLRPYRMPDLKLDDAEVDALTAILLAQGGFRPGDREPAPAPPAAADVAAGERIYRARCTGCHALGDRIPASVPAPTGQDLIRVSERLRWSWLLDGIISEGLDPAQAVQVRGFLWTASGGH